jgi:hypothetical protein
MTLDSLSEFEKFMACHCRWALQDASDVLLFLDSRIPKQEYVQLAGPLFAALATFAEETKRLQFQECESLWTSDAERPDKERMSARTGFGITLAGLQEELKIAAGLFEVNPCPEVMPR